jgi:phenylalanyl-tRNA synthetase beta chain
VLPGGFEISARKTYGKVSEGMICSERELGMGDGHDGILVLPASSGAVPGQDAAELLQLRDDVLDIAVTPDRGYTASIRGVAREAATAFSVPFHDPAAEPPPEESADSYPASIADPSACSRYVLREVRGLDPAAPSPLWLVRRLQKCGVRSISLAVDITNYLMLELGQPLHAWDRGKLQGPIAVRRAERGERMETLDHVVRDLDPGDILITDESGPVNIAGVMGGLTTEIDEKSTEIVIEAAHFSPEAIGRTARRHKLHSDSSYRFERGVDHEIQRQAAAIAVRDEPPRAGRATRDHHPRRPSRPGGGHVLRPRHRHAPPARGRLRGVRRGRADRDPAVVAAGPARPERPRRGGHPPRGV